MPILTFTLGPEAITKIHDALGCLGKFSEAVSIEASRHHLILTALNSSKSAYASISLSSNKFFEKYYFTPILERGQSIEESKFSCKIHNKALLSAFKGRVSDPSKERDTAIERCEASIEDGRAGAKSRLIIKMVCKHGVLKTYRLTFESIVAMHAVFDTKTSKSKWAISSKTLREFAEHFGPGTEQLDICSDEGRVSFTSFTEKIAANNEVLKQPLRTSVAIDTLEFAEFLVEQKLHIVISVKDFKAIVTHAGTLSTQVWARYSEPSRPMQISYGEDGMMSEFILMTIGESRGSSVTPAPAVRPSASRAATRERSSAGASSGRNSRAGSAIGSAAAASEMPPPPRSIAPRISRESQRASNITKPSPEPPQPSLDNEMFFPDEREDDTRWDPADDDDEDEDLLHWDAAAYNDADDRAYWALLRNKTEGQTTDNAAAAAQTRRGSTPHVAPTQKIPRGLFDD